MEALYRVFGVMKDNLRVSPFKFVDLWSSFNYSALKAKAKILVQGPAAGGSVAVGGGARE